MRSQTNDNVLSIYTCIVVKILIQKNVLAIQIFHNQINSF